MSTGSYVFGNMEVGTLVIRQHPKRIKIDIFGDKITFINRYLEADALERYNKSPIGILMNNVSKVKRFMFPNTPFRIRERFLTAKRILNSKIGRK